jgi:hypothetical protein
MSLVFPPCILLHVLGSSTELTLSQFSVDLTAGKLIIQIFTETFEMLATLHEDAGDDEPMLPLAQIGLMLVDWLDPQKTV